MKHLTLFTALILLSGCTDSPAGPEAWDGILADAIPYPEYTVVRTLQEPSSDFQWGFPRMNESGVVVSGGQDNSGPAPVRSLAVWDVTGTPTLHALPGPYTDVRPLDLNQGGLVAGELSGIGLTSMPFLFDLDTGEFDLLPLPDGATSGSATAVNDRGDALVMASFEDPTSGKWLDRTFLYIDGVYTVLPNPGGHDRLKATYIAPDGTILLSGYTQGPPSETGYFLFRKGTATPLELPDHCHAWVAIRHNLVAGICDWNPRKFMVWENGKLTFFGTTETNFTEIRGWARNGAILPHSEKVPYSWIRLPSGTMMAMPEGVSARAINAEGEILVAIETEPGVLVRSIVRLVEEQ
jgi:hypothetical protein